MDCIDPIYYLEKTLEEVKNGIPCYGRSSDWLNNDGDWFSREGDTEKELNFSLSPFSVCDPHFAKRPILGRKEEESSDEHSASDIPSLYHNHGSDASMSGFPDTCRRMSSSSSQHSASDVLSPYHNGSNVSMLGFPDTCRKMSSSSSQHSASDVLSPYHNGSDVSMLGFPDTCRKMSSSSSHSPPSSPAFHSSQNGYLGSLDSSMHDIPNFPDSPSVLQSTRFFDFLETSTSPNPSMFSCLSDQVDFKSPSLPVSPQQGSRGGTPGIGMNGENGSCWEERVPFQFMKQGRNDSRGMYPSNAGASSIVHSPASFLAPIQLAARSTFTQYQADNEEQRQIFCVFCKKNRETREFYATHVLKDNRGKVICPILRKYECPKCGATGDEAHTVRHCPQRDLANGM